MNKVNNSIYKKIIIGPHENHSLGIPQNNELQLNLSQTAF